MPPLSISDFFITVTHPSPHLWIIQTTPSEDNHIIAFRTRGRITVDIQPGGGLSGFFSYRLIRPRPFTVLEEVHLQQTARIEMVEPSLVNWWTEGRVTICVESEDEELLMRQGGRENVYTLAALGPDELVPRPRGQVEDQEVDEEEDDMEEEDEDDEDIEHGEHDEAEEDNLVDEVFEEEDEEEEEEGQEMEDEEEEEEGQEMGDILPSP
ncbi:hypothetical protein B0T20DRAFT_484436 [Sordaria brevicollis]|uniref:Uncharacterized protein n=1 Tax=Sordaria brevicollis TaxID=83679 RepID=A0AAE0NV61_SORBR|nr:hypothetical protein B0T20DRAFT_484436 [Sordaria brevicollis]